MSRSRVRTRGAAATHPPVEVTFLGGLGAIGRNMATIEVDGRIAIVDVGVLFPDAEHLGVDLILPDWRWLVARGDDVEAVFLTHGHLDHIGALPHLLRDLGRSVPVYGSRLTLAFVASNLAEWPELPPADLREVVPGSTVTHEPFEVEVVQVAHSIPDGCAFAFHTPHGTVVHTGDIKLDQTPVDGLPTDLAHLARIGDRGVALLLADSTNAEVAGHVPSERSVAPAIREALAGADGLVVVASFASHVHRIQQVLDEALALGRRPVFVGRSMIGNMGIARELGYLEFDAALEVPVEESDRHDPSTLVVIATGSQGEPFSALSRMAAGDHRQLSLGPGDLVIFASSLIPGNETAVFRSINGLARRGVEVVHGGIAKVHVSGHAAADDLAIIHNVLEPEWVVPVHGEHRHLAAHRRIAIDTGCLPDHVLICEDGDRVLLEGGEVRRGEPVPTSHVYVDGLLPDVGPAMLRDRRRLGEDGVCIAVVTVDTRERERAADSVVTQRGLVLGEHVDDLLAAARRAVDDAVDALPTTRLGDTAAVQREVVQTLARFWKRETGRRPVILPIVQEF
ncbi:MAG: ribonuclease J [Nitriliruptoraceae bacterium]